MGSDINLYTSIMHVLTQKMCCIPILIFSVRYSNYVVPQWYRDGAILKWFSTLLMTVQKYIITTHFKDSWINFDLKPLECNTLIMATRLVSRLHAHEQCYCRYNQKMKYTDGEKFGDKIKVCTQQSLTSPWKKYYDTSPIIYTTLT